MGDALIGLMLLLHSITGAQVEIDPIAVHVEAVEALEVLVEIAEEQGGLPSVHRVVISTAPPFELGGVSGSLDGGVLTVYTWKGHGGYTAAHEAGHVLDLADDGQFNGSLGLPGGRDAGIAGAEYDADYWALTWALNHGRFGIAADGFALLAWRCENIYPGWC